jgi:hypothetical protein
MGGGKEDIMMVDNIIGAAIILAIIHFMFIFEIKVIVTYKRKNREAWRARFAGKNILEKIAGLIQWLHNQKEYEFTCELSYRPLSYVNGLICEIDTHGKGGWEKEETP